MRYFFHTIENGRRTFDVEGVELPDDDTARWQAAQFLSEVAADSIPHDGGRRFGVEVRTESGSVLTAIGFTLDEGPEVGM